MIAELRAEEIRSGSSRPIASVTSADARQVTTNEGVREVFRQNFQDLFTREAGLSSAQVGTYLADFPCLEATEAARCEGPISEDEIRDALSRVGNVFEAVTHVCSLAGSSIQPLVKAGLYSPAFPQGVVKLLRKDKDGGDGIDNVRPITLLNTELEILAKILSDRLKTVLSRSFSFTI